MENKEIIEDKNVMEQNIDKKGNILQKDLNLKETLLVIGIFVIIAGYIGVFILPKYKMYKNSVSQLEQVQQQIIDYESQIGSLSDLEQELKSLNSEIEVERKKLSHNMEDGMFLVGLSNLINSLDLDLVSYTIDETISYNTFYAIPTNIEVRGDYNYIRKIMDYLEAQKNTTQILDYNMETYIEEEIENVQEDNVETMTTTDSTVYWTDGGSMFHKSGCSVLTLEQNTSLGEVHSGNADESGKNSPCETCKPYTETSTENEEIKSTEPVATGEVVATFKFIMYSTENPKYGLGIEDNNNWQPGKYNPFTSTTR